MGGIGSGSASKRVQYHKDFIPKIERRGGFRDTAGRTRKEKLIYQGKEYRFGELAKLANVSKIVLKHRLHRGWPIEKALYAPTVKKHQRMGFKDAIEIYQFVMRRFYTKEHRLESYKRLILEMKQQRMRKAA